VARPAGLNCGELQIAAQQFTRRRHRLAEIIALRDSKAGREQEIPLARVTARDPAVSIAMVSRRCAARRATVVFY
jgi:hypothetical protein